MRGWVWLCLLAGCDRVLGLGPITTATIVAPGPTTLAAGYGHTCWIRGDGTLWCWGANDQGQLGLASDVAEDDTIGQIGDATWTAVASADGTTCGIQHGGTLWCWGGNGNGQLGTGDTRSRNAPTQIANAWQAVSVSLTHTCAIDSKGAVWCWGANGNGQLGDGTTTDQPAPEQVATGFIAIASGAYHTCGIQTDHSLACWGGNFYGQLGDGTNQNQLAPITIGTDRWSQLAAGNYHTCGVTTTGHLRCWGAGFSGQLGTGTTDDQPTPSAVLLAGTDASDWLGVVAGPRQACAWNADQAYCWGDSSRGELGIDGVAIDASPVAFPAGPWLAMGLGTHHSCAVDAGGALWCMGANGWGQLGTGNTSQLAPELIDSSMNWQAVHAGRWSTCARSQGGQMACAGDNFNGELGLGDRTSRQALPSLGTVDWIHVTVADSYACGITGAGTPECWGSNNNGQLGIGSAAALITTPQPLSLGAGTVASDVAASDHTCARDGSDHLYCWGANADGELATTPGPPTNAPGARISAGGVDVWRSVAVGVGFTCGVIETGTTGESPVYCWGRNTDGQLGNGTTSTTDNPVPAQIATSELFYQVYAGAQHACALKLDGTAWCWGYDATGAVGNGGFGNQPTPVPIARTWKNPASISAPAMALGNGHTCAIDKASLGLYCWGDNSRGQLGTGNGSRSPVNVPTRIGSATWGWVAAGAYHTCGVSNGAIYCWGSNDDGALLDGKAWVATPVQVPAP